MMVVGAAALVSAAFAGPDTLLRYAAPCLLVGTVGWAAFWYPHVEVSDGGVTVVNTLRTVRVPWPAIQDVEGRYGLRLTTAYGPVTAWAAGAPAGRQRARGQDSEAAQAVTARLDALRAAGHLDNPRLERDAPVTTWHRGVVAALALLVLASVLLLTLT